jgi:ubiquinone/menaquinone biosynthesis C-methylase UbiE
MGVLMPGALPASREGRRIIEHFDARSTWWDHVYEDESLQARILRRRQALALSWVDGLRLPTGASILEIGCGAGSTSVELARRGYAVQGLDLSEAMIRRARSRAAAAGLRGAVAFHVGDAHELPVAAGTVDLVLAIGVLSWLADPETAVREMSRVTKPDGHVLVTSLSSVDLPRLLDPLRSPVLRPVRVMARQAAARLGRCSTHHRFIPRRYQKWQVKRLLRNGGLHPIKVATVGFGPFSLFGRKPLPEAISLRLDEALQRLAEWGVPPFRSVGRLCLVLASRSTAQAGEP